jgi:hypothetical protein
MFSLPRFTRAFGFVAALALVPAAEAQSDKIAFIADMDASQVITGSASGARGTAIMIIDPVINMATIEVVM